MQPYSCTDVLDSSHTHMSIRLRCQLQVIRIPEPPSLCRFRYMPTDCPVSSHISITPYPSLITRSPPSGHNGIHRPTNHQAEQYPAHGLRHLLPLSKRLFRASGIRKIKAENLGGRGRKEEGAESWRNAGELPDDGGGERSGPGGWLWCSTDET